MNEDILKQLESAGLYLATTEQKAENVLRSEPHYKGNYGFHTVEGAGFKAILIKGVYKDFLRIISGNTDINEGNWCEVAKTLNTGEAALKSPLSISLFLKDGNAYILSAKECQGETINYSADLRDFTIPRPLTSVEYALPASKLYDDEIMLSSGFFAEMLPKTVSTFTESVFAKLPDILNPIFASCNLKTVSPSVLNLYNRIYINMTGFEKMHSCVGMDNSTFRLFFAPHLFLKLKEKPKTKDLNNSYFPVTNKEILELINETAAEISFITAETVKDDAFLEYPVKLTIAYEYFVIKSEALFANLMKIFPTMSLALNAVFKTRQNSIFGSEKLELPESLEFGSNIHETCFNMTITPESIDTFLAQLPFFTRMGQAGTAKKLIKNLHDLLDLRDELYKACANFIIKSQKALLVIGEFGVTKGKTDKPEDIFLFEYDEVKRIYGDSFFGDTAQSMNFRRWQLWRYAAQCLTPEIYGQDIENAGQITEQMIGKFLDLAEFDALALNGESMEGRVTADYDKKSYDGYIVAAHCLSVANINKFADATGFILENANPMGFACEYAVLKNIPLYSGLRFAPLLLKGLKVKSAGNKIARV